ncbi:MAG TPA: 2Fe-2S iron-sulfur cluster-binding protein [Acidimicrobiales bacterium]|nr:2Fe-2S iron-sulfur cluster-binding protein [Acidimicrobiales bacterium]
MEPRRHPPTEPGELVLTVDGTEVRVPDRGTSLLDVLRDDLHAHGVKDGCSPQGQCGCCTVLVDGAPRVACVTPARRVAGRSVDTVNGLGPEVRDRWSSALVATGGSQCGFCTPGVIVRLEGLRRRAGEGPVPSVDEAAESLRANLCRCTGWRTILEAYELVIGPDPVAGRARSLAPAEGDATRRARLEGRTGQAWGTEVALGHGSFAADHAPPDALVALPDGRGGWVVGETAGEVRALAARVQGRRTTVESVPPLDVPNGDWDLVLRTSWVEPAYLEPDASWCAPGGEPWSPVANGGAFGGKRSTVVCRAARELADRHGRPVLAMLTREDVVRLGPKRPPIAAGLRRDGSGVVRVVRAAGIADRIRSVLPDVEVDEVDVPGPPVSVDLRAAGWAEAAILRRELAGGDEPIGSPDGGRAWAEVDGGGSIRVRVAAGDPLDVVVLRSYVIGAAHMALGWVTSESLAVDASGEVHDLTIRSFGVVRAADTPVIEVEIDRSPEEVARPGVNGSDAAFAAVAAAVWRHQGRPPDWPTRVPLRPR